MITISLPGVVVAMLVGPSALAILEAVSGIPNWSHFGERVFYFTAGAIAAVLIGKVLTY